MTEVNVNGQNVLSFGPKKVIDKPIISDKTIIVLKLITGEDILGVVSSKKFGEKNMITIDSAARIVIIPTQQGHSMAFVPLSPFSDSKTLVVDEDHVVYQFEANAQITAEYKKTFSGVISPVVPGLVIPTK